MTAKTGKTATIDQTAKAQEVAIQAAAHLGVATGANASSALMMLIQGAAMTLDSMNRPATGKALIAMGQLHLDPKDKAAAKKLRHAQNDLNRAEILLRASPEGQA